MGYFQSPAQNWGSFNKNSEGDSDLIKVRGQVGSQLHHQVPPHLHLGEQQGFCPDVDGREWLHQELDTFGTAQDVFRQSRSEIKTLVLISNSLYE